MNTTDFQTIVEKKLGNYMKLPDYPFNKKMAYAIFPGAEENFINETVYGSLFELNAKYGNARLLIKPHFVDINDQALFLKQSHKDWDSFSDLQDNHLTCEGIYLCGDAFNWLGIYHYDDYLIVGGIEDFINDLCDLVYGDSDWRSKFSLAFEEGEISMYQSDFDRLIEKLF